MIKTGKAPITALTLCAIMSISLVVNLPGLAVTPMLGSLGRIFPGTTQLEKQLLTILPNLLIIPFVLLSGKLSLARHKLPIIVGALALFCGSAIWYMLASSMAELIIISCLIGIGAGLLIPFSTGLIADTFSGDYRMRIMGLQSGLSNSVLVIATFVVGWLSRSGNWHAPFAVYLVGLVPLAMVLWLRNAPDMRLAAPAAAASAGAAVSAPAPDTGEKPRDGFYVNKILSLVGVYFFVTFATIAISYYCPFLIEKHDWSASLTGTVTAVYFLFILLPGYTLSWFVKVFKGNTFLFAAISMTVGMALFALVPSTATMIVGAALAGLGYGICQPLLYDKGSVAVSDPSKATMSLAFVLSANYFAIVVSPFIIDGLRGLLHAGNVPGFAFIVCAVLLVAFTVLVWTKRHSFAFSINKSYYEKPATTQK